MASADTTVHRIDSIDPNDLRLFGGKATGLARMATNGIPIPPAFVISTEGYQLYCREKSIPEDFARVILAAVDELAQDTARAFATGSAPLLVSVRSGAAVSMPGMMDTILNLGLDARSAVALAEETGSPAFVVDTWSRFFAMYAETVLGLAGDKVAEDIRKEREQAEREPTLDNFAALEGAAVSIIEAEGENIPGDPRDQLLETVAAVFRSWDSRRAKAYREHHGIPDDMGTAVTVQSMVFGNMDANSGTGVAFTRDPNTGAKTLYGEYLAGHQGEDLVAGTHTPIKLTDAAMPHSLTGALAKHGDTLEAIYRDAVDIEFTVQSGSLYFLQVRTAKRTSAAAIRVALDQLDEGLIDERTAVRRVTTEQIVKLMRPGFEAGALDEARVLARGLGSSPGQATGAAFLDSDKAVEHAEAGQDVILLRPITSPQDIRGMLASNGIITARGGALSHAAVVSRALDKPCIVGCQDIEIDLDARTFTIGGERFDEGAEISMDGADGRIFEGSLRVSASGADDPLLGRFFSIARSLSEATVWPVPRNLNEATRAVARGAEGLGLVALSDLIIAADSMGDFTAGIAQLTYGGDPSPGVLDAVAALVHDGCLPLFRAAAGRPFHLRLPQLRSERARDLMSNWEDIPPAQFLPLGSLDFSRAMLRGVSTAHDEASDTDVTVFCGGFTDPMEFRAFRDEFGELQGVAAGLLVQNTVMLYRLAEAPLSDTPVWIDVNEILRTAHGYPTHVLQMPSILDDYMEAGRLTANPLRDTHGMLATPLDKIGRTGIEGIGISGAGGLTEEYLGFLHGSGFRRFSAPAASADIVSVRLACL